MFSRTDLDALPEVDLDDWKFSRSYRGLHYHVYPGYAFRVPDSEQYVRIARAPRVATESGLRFWISAELAEEFSGPRADYIARYLKGASFRGIAEGEFNLIVENQCGELLVPPALPLHPSKGFIGGLAMYNLESEFIVSIFAEYDDEFIHFYWESTA